MELYLFVRLTVVTCACLISGHAMTNQTEGEFLKSTIYKIQKERLTGDSPSSSTESHLNQRLTGFSYSPEQVAGDSYVGTEMEQLALTKDQLLSLYHAAVNQGSKINMGDLPFMGDGLQSDNPMIQSTEQGQIPGYYYYFYPITNFLKDQVHGEAMVSDSPDPMKPNQNQMSSMGTHKTIEPLFAAMASFVGVAMMFIMTILFLPKFGALKSRGIIFKQGSEEFATFTRILAETVEGKDCSQRIACEVGKTVRTMHLGINTIKILELLLPQNLAKQLARIRRSAAKREKCNFIKCKAKNQKPPSSSSSSEEKAI